MTKEEIKKYIKSQYAVYDQIAKEYADCTPGTEGFEISERLC